MKKMNRLTQEALSVLKAIYEDQVEDRFAYRNEGHRLTASGLTCSFVSLVMVYAPSTVTPIDRAVPSIIRMADSMQAALRSSIFSSAIAFTCSRVTEPTFSR